MTGELNIAGQWRGGTYAALRSLDPATGEVGGRRHLRLRRARRTAREGRPSAYPAAADCAYPVASFEAAAGVDTRGEMRGLTA